MNINLMEELRELLPLMDDDLKLEVLALMREVQERDD